MREAASKGVVVYVMRSLSFLDFLCLDFLLKKFGLPLVRFVNDLGLWILEPFGKGERRLSLRRQIPEAEALQQTVGDGFSALLFLRRPPKFGSQARRGRELEVDLIETLVAKQRISAQAILLVPQTFVWSKQAGTASPSMLDLLFGPVQWPGRVRVFCQFLLNYRDAKLRSGEPFDLHEFLEKNPDLTDSEAADKVRYALLRRMERDRAVIIGPMKKTTARIQDELLRSPRVRTHIEQYAAEKDISYTKAEGIALKQLQKLCAKQSLFVVDLMHRFLTWVWSKMYDGVVIDKEGIERLREASRDASLVLLPSHKSHIDYLVLSDMLYGTALMPPLSAAGDNLSFWPSGRLLRRGGGGGTVPVADAGAAIEASRNDLVTLDGSASSDPEGDALTYTWTQTRGADVTAGAGVFNGVNPSFTADTVDTLVFELVVSDGTSDSAADTVGVNLFEDLTAAFFVDGGFASVAISARGELDEVGDRRFLNINNDGLFLGFNRSFYACGRNKLVNLG